MKQLNYTLMTILKTARQFKASEMIWSIYKSNLAYFVRQDRFV
jgi:hypothetical protein